jgi:hypothetical protein
VRISRSAASMRGLLLGEQGASPGLAVAVAPTRAIRAVVAGETQARLQSGARSRPRVARSAHQRGAGVDLGDRAATRGSLLVPGLLQVLAA